MEIPQIDVNEISILHFRVVSVSNQRRSEGLCWYFPRAIIPDKKGPRIDDFQLSIRRESVGLMSNILNIAANLWVIIDIFSRSLCMFKMLLTLSEVKQAHPGMPFPSS